MGQLMLRIGYAIGDFLTRETADIGQVLDELQERSPYKTGDTSNGAQAGARLAAD